MSVFFHQQKKSDDAPPLTMEVIRKVAKEFQESVERKHILAKVDKSVVWDTKYSLKAANKATAESAMNTGKSRIAHQYSKDEYALWGAPYED